MRIERCGLDAEGTAGGLLKRIPAEWRRGNATFLSRSNMYVRACSGWRSWWMWLKTAGRDARHYAPTRWLSMTEVDRRLDRRSVFHSPFTHRMPESSPIDIRIQIDAIYRASTHDGWEAV